MRVVPHPQELQEQMLCIICTEQEKNMMIVPCGHVVACGTCWRGLEACPMCRVAIQRCVEIKFE